MTESPKTMNTDNPLLNRYTNIFRESYKSEGMSPGTIGHFRKIVRAYYKKHKRPMPWRNITNHYRIFISEVMLQQTQVDRVRTKYAEFTGRFPDFASLASAPLRDVLSIWQGLGYNRRALFLKQSAEIIQKQYNGRIPERPDELATLPGIGHATASSIYVFAFNRPCTFIETNIRTVYIHYFYPEKDTVRDTELLPVIEQTMDTRNPREWFYALMDYGVHLKKLYPGRNAKSAHYHKQSAFDKSDRKIRGEIIRMMLKKTTLSAISACRATGESPERIVRILEGMEKDGLIKKYKRSYIMA